MSLTANAEIQKKTDGNFTARFLFNYALCIMHYALCIISQTSTNPILLLH